MLYDSDFLKRLDEYREKTIYGRIVSLTMDENPIEQIEGQITTGSINVDGNSAVRRTCSLTMVSQDININDYYWGLNTKFRLEIGVENVVDNKYPDIIWFKMGTYIITSFNLNLGLNSYTISLQGKDKMCLLNGEVGGVINATTDFGTYDYTDENGNTVNKKYPIKDIIWDMVHAYAGEPFHNIIINDLDELGLELLDYKYDTPMYIFRNPGSDEYSGETLFGDDGKNYVSEDGDEKYNLDNIAMENGEEFYFDNLTSSMLGYGHTPTSVFRDSPINGEGRIEYYVSKIEYGYTAGYRTCDLVYAGDLIANIGDSITSVLDKLKGMLGEFEYFYDLDGRFVFQRKKSLVNTVWTPQRRDGDRELYVESLAAASNSMYDFSGTVLIASIQNNPNLLNLRNDYTVWGVKKGVTGQEMPIHMRYAIDNKPEIYVDYNNEVWTTFSESEIQYQNAARTTKKSRADIYRAWKNFKRNVDLYPTSMVQNAGMRDPYISEDESWWHLEEWAEYYKILFGEYPGNNHPDDEMKIYCKDNGNASQFLSEWTGYRAVAGSQINMSQVLWNASYAIMIIYHFTNGDRQFYGYDGHMGGGCVHTYGQWLDIQYYVNGTTIDGQEYQPFDPNYPWNLSYDQRTGNISYIDFNDPQHLIDWRDRYGLDHVEVYCYNPTIPEARREARMEAYEEEIAYEDPYEGQYYYDMDWRELIYRMAIDYRRHNHDNDFEIQIQNRHLPWNLYEKGVTGYEQYYTDLEGFWRELYNPLISDDEVQKSKSYVYQKYSNIKDKTDFENIYVKGVYKPIAQKVKAVIEENQKPNVRYVEDQSTGKKYPYYPDTYYFISETNGFSFEEPMKYVEDDEVTDLNNGISNFIECAAAGKLYTRNYQSLSTMYMINNDRDGMYKVMDLQKYVYDAEDINNRSDKKHFLKNTKSADPQNPEYTLIDKTTSVLSSSQKSGSYIMVNESSYDEVVTQIEEAQINYDEMFELSDTVISILTAQDASIIDTNSEIISYILNDIQEFSTPVSEALQDKLNISNKTEFVNELLNRNTPQDQNDLFKSTVDTIDQVIEQLNINLRIIKNTANYQLFLEYLQNSLYNINADDGISINNKIDQLNNYFIYEDDNYYCLSDIYQNPTLRDIYFTTTTVEQDNIEIIEEQLINYSLDNNANKTAARPVKKNIYYYSQVSKFYDTDDDEVNRRFWNKDVFEAPQSLIFWFDFLTGDGELRQFTTQAVGDRPKAINDTNVKSIYYRDTPKIIFTTQEKLASEERKTGYNYFILPSQSGYENMFSISTQGIDAKNRIDELIYQFSYCTETISLQTIPVYYLDVNRRITVYDKETGINGEYVVSRITYPLQYNGMMTIAATKAPENSVTEREE